MIRNRHPWIDRHVASSPDVRLLPLPEILNAIKPSLLVLLLERFSDLQDRLGIETLEESDVEQVVESILASDNNPSDLWHALYLIHEMATPDAMAELLEDESLSRAVGTEPTPADVATLAWIRDAEALERKQSKLIIERPRKFDYFVGKGPAPRHHEAFVDRSKINEVSTYLHNWFLSSKRGGEVWILDVPRGHLIWYIVRHGDLFKRDGAVQSGNFTSVYYRPQRNDIVAYDLERNELRISLMTKAAKAEYRKAWGRVFFDDENYFNECRKFSLEPLRKGPSSLDCGINPVMYQAKLVELRYHWPGRSPETEIHKSKDVFASLDSRDAKIPVNADLVSASFEIKLSHWPICRTITLRPPNILEARRDEDLAFIERWLEDRGFITRPEIMEQ